MAPKKDTVFPDAGTGELRPRHSTAGFHPGRHRHRGRRPHRGGPGLVATTGPRYFGFVIGGAVASATAADLLATGWDQPAYNAVSAPAAAVVEEVSGEWLKELLGIPATASFGFVTGAQAANTVGLAAARHSVLARGRLRRRARWSYRRAASAGDRQCRAPRDRRPLVAASRFRNALCRGSRSRRTMARSTLPGSATCSLRLRRHRPSSFCSPAT